MSQQEHITLPSELPPALGTDVPPPYDLTIVTILRSGRHFAYHTRIQEGDDPARIAQAHCIVRGHYNADAERFIVITGTGGIETVEAQR